MDNTIAFDSARPPAVSAEMPRHDRTIDAAPANSAADYPWFSQYAEGLQLPIQAQASSTGSGVRSVQDYAVAILDAIGLS